MLVISTGEIFLKGKNKGFFIKKLMKNVREALGTQGIVFQQNKIICGQEEGYEKIGRICGITHYAIAKKAAFDEIGKVALSFVQGQKTFRITAHRRVKVGKTSEELNREIGGVILEKYPDIKVKLKDPELEIYIDVFRDAAYIYTNPIPGIGGLPVGVSGEVYIDVTNGENATVAGFLMMKRGCTVATAEELPLLKKFAYGCTIEARPAKKGEVRVSDETEIETIVQDRGKEILFPLAGMQKEEITAIYEKIQGL